MSTMTGNPTYNLTAMFKEEILQNNNSVMLTFGISLSEEDIDLPKLYWISKLHKKSAESDVAPAGIKSYKFLFVLKKIYFAVFKKLIG